MDVSGLIVGLGNPGERYARTRHNIGFMLIDSVLEEVAQKPYRRLTELRTPSDYQLFSVSLPRAKGDYLLLKPLTYMNLSGKAVMRVCKEYGVSPKSMLVAHDEMDLPLGRMKLKRGGGTAGHNGVSSIIQETGTDDFTRLRLGVGRPQKGRDVKDYVLENFSESESAVVKDVIEAARKGLAVYFAQGQHAAMQALHPLDFRPPTSETAGGESSEG